MDMDNARDSVPVHFIESCVSLESVEYFIA